MVLEAAAPPSCGDDHITAVNLTRPIQQPIDPGKDNGQRKYTLRYDKMALITSGMDSVKYTDYAPTKWA